MKKLVITLAIVTLVSPTVQAQDVNTSPAKKAVFVTGAPMIDYTGVLGETVLSAEIAKGKKKSVLTIEGMIALPSSSVQSLIAAAYVNGTPAQPGTIATDCNADEEACTVHGSWVVDIDADDTLINQPITIDLLANPGGIGPTTTTATLIVRMEKKK